LIKSHVPNTNAINDKEFVLKLESIQVEAEEEKYELEIDLDGG